MDIEAAHINQLRRARDGRLVEIDADVGNVVADLKRIDPCLGVRFAEASQCWIVYWRSEDGSQTYLVTSVNAEQNRLGVWTGLDQRVVKRIQKIDPHNGYDYVTELQRQDERAREAHREQFRERVEPIAELAAAAVRKDLGTRYRGRAFVPKDVPHDAA